MQRYRPQLALLVLWLGGLALPASAQTSPQQLTDATRQAMEAYTNLDVEEARSTLEKAIRQAEKAGVSGPALARAYSSLGVVFVGGLGDQAAGASAFEKALKEDPSIEPDPIVATPEVMAAYKAAKGRGGRAPTPRASPRRRAPGPVEGNLDHKPAAEQLAQTAVPVFVAKSPELDIDTMKLSYRSLGMKKPKTVELAETDDGFTFLIPCVDVFEPVVEYFIVALDDDGKVVGNSGTAANPIAVPIVRERTQPAPSLPGQVPPSQCSADDECPPGMPGCRGSAGMGDTCSADSDCQSGLMCEDDFCVVGERDEDADTASGGSSGKRFFVDVSFGVAATSVRKGRAPDRPPTQSTIDEVDKQSRTPENQLDLDRADALLRGNGFDCTPAEDEGRLLVKNCTVAVDPGGFVAVPIINVAAGYFVTPKLALAITGRFQLSRGEGPLAGTLLGARAEYLLTQPVETGLRVGLLGGLAIGQMQARPPPTKEGVSAEGPFATNASTNGAGFGAAISVGARAGYRFLPNLGITLTPALSLGFPNLLLALDATAGVEVAF